MRNPLSKRIWKAPDRNSRQCQENKCHVVAVLDTNGPARRYTAGINIAGRTGTEVFEYTRGNAEETQLKTN